MLLRVNYLQASTHSCSRWSGAEGTHFRFWYNRGRRLWPTTAAERELWTIWIGYLMCYFFALGTVRLLVGTGLLVAGPEAPPLWEDLVLYPFSALISGMLRSPSFRIGRAITWPARMLRRVVSLRRVVR